MNADIPNVPVYRAPHPVSINHAEFIALRSIVMSMVCVMAGEFQRVSGQPAQSFINDLAIASIEAISKADISATDGRDMEGVRSAALQQVNNILGGILFPRQSDKPN